MVFRNHKLHTRDAHCYRDGHDSSAFQLTQLGSISSQDELHNELIQTLPIPIHDYSFFFLLNFINFTFGSSFFHALNLSSQICQYNHSLVLSYNGQWPQNNIITTIHDMID